MHHIYIYIYIYSGCGRVVQGAGHKAKRLVLQCINKCEFKSRRVFMFFFGKYCLTKISNSVCKTSWQNITGNLFQVVGAKFADIIRSVIECSVLSYFLIVQITFHVTQTPVELLKQQKYGLLEREKMLYCNFWKYIFCLL